MKKNIFRSFYLLSGLVMSGLAVSCSQDFEDASSRHSYGENDEVFVNTKVGANYVLAANAPTTQQGETMSFPLSEVSNEFQTQFNMSVSEVVKAVNAGILDFKVISSSRGVWLTAAKNAGLGWYFNLSNKPCEAAESAYSLKLNADKNTIDVVVNKGVAAGTSLDAVVGFGYRNEHFGTYDQYVKYELVMSVTDPTVVMAKLDLAQGDYAGYEFFFEDDYDDQFKACMGLTAQEALDGIENGTVGFYVTDADGKSYEVDYTADAGDGYYGYWMDGEGKVCAWGAGAVIFADAELIERAIYLGRYPGIATGTQMKVYLKMNLKANPDKFIRFIFDCYFL